MISGVKGKQKSQGSILEGMVLGHLGLRALAYGTVFRTTARDGMVLDANVPCVIPSSVLVLNEPRHEKTNVLHGQKQRRRSASR